MSEGFPLTHDRMLVGRCTSYKQKDEWNNSLLSEKRDEQGSS